MTVDQMIDDIIRREGGFVDHPADRGGPTKYGITLGTFRVWCSPNATPEDMNRMVDKEVAARIYRDAYYFQPGLNKLPPAIQPFVFDSAVNHGAPQAIKFVQEVCNMLGTANTPLALDGICGSQTAQAAAEAWADWDAVFLLELVLARAEFYATIIKRDRSQRVFLKGWLKRLREFM